MDNDGDQVMDGQVGQNVGQNVNVPAAIPIPPQAIPHYSQEG